MLVVSIIFAVVALGLGFLWFQARQQIDELRSQLSERTEELALANADLESTRETLASSRSRVEQQDKRIGDLDVQVSKLTTERDETVHALHKRTELADAQAMQIDVLSAERDEVQQRLNDSELRIEALAARPGAMVGQVESDEDSATLWDLEVARTERLWRASVATNPTDPVTPFAETDDPVRTAVEIEIAALREDVGALISLDWQASIIEEPARRLVALRVAQELLAEAAKAPGASRLIVTETAEQESQADSSVDIDLTEEPKTTEGTASTAKSVGSLIFKFEPVGGNDNIVGSANTQVSEVLRS